MVRISHLKYGAILLQKVKRYWQNGRMERPTITDGEPLRELIA